MWQQRIKAAIEKQKRQDRYRSRIQCQSQDSTALIAVAGKSYLNFSSNDYLGLANDPNMIQIAISAAQKYGVGSGGSGHVTGYSEPLQKLESALANWLGYDAAIVYPSGFTANQAVIKLLIERDDHIIADRLSHASLLEAAMFSQGRLNRFKHNDIESLESYLKRAAARREEQSALDPESTALNLVITEGIFSMDGDTAPLTKIAALSKKYQSLLMVDDAHGIGLLGESGKGSCNQFGIKPDILIVTFGKAFGCSGAAVLVSHELAEYFVQFSRPLIYSTAIAPMQGAILLKAIDIIKGDLGERKRQILQENIRYFKEAINKVLVSVQDYLQMNNDHMNNNQMNNGDKEREAILPYLLHSESPIQPLIVGEDEMALKLSQRLQNAGIWVSAIRPPTVPPQTARLRITITAEHTFEMIDQFMVTLKTALISLNRDLNKNLKRNLNDNVHSKE